MATDQQTVPAAVVLGPGEGRRVPLGDAADVTLKAVAADTGGALSAYECVVPPATAGPPTHLHRDWDEAFYVLEGEMGFLVGGREHAAPAGSFVFVPHGIPHTFWNASAAPARQLTVFTPAGIEAYFDEVSRAMAAGGEDALEAASALMERHGMVVLADAGPAYGALS
jgi:quercetin dioxygenase-like cupin family protein